MFTMHGVAMIFFFLIPAIPAVLAIFLVPLMCGAKDLAFPRLNLASWYIYVAGALFSLYGLVRYVNQLPGEQTFIDHLGRERTVKARHDINWHRTMIWFSGFALTPRLNYTLTVWSLPTTQQTLAFGNLQFRFNKALTLGAGIGPTLTARSMQGSHPFWASSDRQMSEEFFRGGFSSGVWLKGEPLHRLTYTLSVNTNLSQLGITGTNDSRDMAYSASVAWLPTTGEFGLRGGLADFEEHQGVATRFGFSVIPHSPRAAAPPAPPVRGAGSPATRQHRR